MLRKSYNEGSLTDLLFRNYDGSKLHPAIRINNENMTYEELYLKALKLASILKDNGAYDQTVAIVGHRNFSTYV